eukprot:468426-Alexandrium_andersonii.AAC.1
MRGGCPHAWGRPPPPPLPTARGGSAAPRPLAAVGTLPLCGAFNRRRKESRLARKACRRLPVHC